MMTLPQFMDDLAATGLYHIGVENVKRLILGQPGLTNRQKVRLEKEIDRLAKVGKARRLQGITSKNTVQRFEVSG